MSLTASFVRWLSYDDPSFTRVVASKDSRTVVAATTHARIWVFDVVGGSQHVPDALNGSSSEAIGSEEGSGIRGTGVAVCSEQGWLQRI